MSKKPQTTRDPISGPSIQRMGFKAGVTSMKRASFAPIRALLSKHANEVLQHSIIFAKNAKRNTVQDHDVRDALQLLGRPLMFADNSSYKRKIETPKGTIKRTVMTDRSRAINACGTYAPVKKLGKLKLKAPAPAPEPMEGGAGKRRFHPGVVALRKGKYYQKHSNHCFSIGQIPFRRLINSLCEEPIRFTKDAVRMIHLDTEDYITNALKGAGMVALQSKRLRVSPQDLKVTMSLQEPGKSVSL
jgi:histone H3/H4